VFITKLLKEKRAVNVGSLSPFWRAIPQNTISGDEDHITSAIKKRDCLPPSQPR